MNYQVPNYWRLLESCSKKYIYLAPWNHGWLVDFWVYGRCIFACVIIWKIPLPATCLWFYCTSAAMIFIVAEILTYQTGTVLLHNKPKVALRLLILTFISYLTIGLAFSAIYILQQSELMVSVPILSNPQNAVAPGKFDLVYFSFVTLGTIGFGDIHPGLGKSGAEATVIAEHLVGLYFYAVVLVVIVNMASPSESDTSH